MRLPRWASLLVTFCLLASASTAYAERAWVLWMHTTTFEQPTGTEWAMRNGFVAVAACKTAAVEAVKNSTRTLSNAEAVGDTMFVLRSGSKIAQTVELICLPDSAPDPRGPKGK
jgi:hypothetical protein